MTTGCKYIRHMSPQTIRQLEIITGAPPHRWADILPRLTRPERLEFGYIAMECGVKKVWIDPNSLGSEDIIICAEW